MSSAALEEIQVHLATNAMCVWQDGPAAAPTVEKRPQFASQQAVCRPVQALGWQHDPVEEGYVRHAGLKACLAEDALPTGAISPITAAHACQGAVPAMPCRSYHTQVQIAIGGLLQGLGIQ